MENLPSDFYGWLWWILSVVVVGFSINLITAFIWDIVQKSFSLILHYPNVKGGWIGQYGYKGRMVKEEIEITQQFLSHFRGTVTAVNPNKKNDVREYGVIGRFISHDVIIGTFTSRFLHFHTDVGAFMFKFNFAYGYAEGGSVSYDVDQFEGPPVARYYKIVRKNHGE